MSTEMFDFKEAVDCLREQARKIGTVRIGDDETSTTVEIDDKLMTAEEAIRLARQSKQT